MLTSDIANNLRNAQRELKQSKKKDYYKILEIQRGASDDEIKKVCSHRQRQCTVIDSFRRRTANSRCCTTPTRTQLKSARRLRPSSSS